MIERAVAFYHDELLSHARREPRPAVPALAGLRRARSVRQFSLGWAPEAGGTARAGRLKRRADAARESRACPSDPAGSARCVPGPGDLPDLRPDGLRDRARRPAPARRTARTPARSTATPPRRRSMRSAAPSTASTGPSRRRYRPARSSSARVIPTSSGSSPPACRGPLPRAGPRSPKSTSGSWAGSRSGSCSPSTPTRPASRPRLGSMTGSDVTSSRSPSPPSRRAAIPPTSPSAIRRRCGRRWRGRGRFWRSGWRGRWPARELQTGEGQAHAAEAALAMVAEHPNELVRDQYLVTVSDRTRLEVERLRPRLDRLVVAFEASKRSGAAAGRAAGRRERAAVAAGCRAAVGAGPRLGPEDSAPEAGRTGEAREVGGKPGRWHPAGGPAWTHSCWQSASPEPWRGGSANASSQIRSSAPPIGH